MKDKDLIKLSSFSGDVGRKSLYDMSNNTKIIKETLLTNKKDIASCLNKDKETVVEKI